MDKIAAIVVTYNRISFLKEIIEALKIQTRKPDLIIVINNSSSDGTTEWLESQNELMIVNQENTGSSGGQYTGFKTAYELGFDWIWTMDDDVVPKANCLETLLVNFDENTIRAPYRLLPNGNVYLNDAISYNLTNPFKSFWKGIISEKNLAEKYSEAVGITFEGPLLHRSIISRIGYPDKKFFIFGDDTEYFIRAWKAGARLIVIRDALLQRKLEPVTDLTQFNFKTYYMVRNLVALNVIHGNRAVRIIRPFYYFFKWLTNARNLKDVKTVLKGFWDGYLYKQL